MNLKDEIESDKQPTKYTFDLQLLQWQVSEGKVSPDKAAEMIARHYAKERQFDWRWAAIIIIACILTTIAVMNNAYAHP